MKIIKCTLKEGFALVSTEANSKYKTRKIYTWKTGSLANRMTIDVNANVYSFIWGLDGETATDIRFEKNYSKKGEKHAKIFNTGPLPPRIKEESTPLNGKITHEKFQQILICVESKIPVYLVGPAGSGKNHTLEQIAEELGLEFYFTNSVQQEYKLTGFIDAGGRYHETEFYKAFRNGGLFFLDEMDASIPEVLVLLNAAIANGYFEFPNGKINAHEDFRIVSAGNTVGNGADEQYTGRLVLDQATLDRFVIIHFDYSLRIEMAITKGNTELVNFVRELRKQASEKGIRATFSYRCLAMVTKLENKIELSEILIIAIFKGFDRDTIRTFKSSSTDKNRYAEALIKVQA